MWYRNCFGIVFAIGHVLLCCEIAQCVGPTHSHCLFFFCCETVFHFFRFCCCMVCSAVRSALQCLVAIFFCRLWLMMGFGFLSVHFREGAPSFLIGLQLCRFFSPRTISARFQIRRMCLPTLCECLSEATMTAPGQARRKHYRFLVQRPASKSSCRRSPKLMPASIPR